MTERNIAQALNAALDLALDDDAVVLMGEDVGRTGGVFRVSDGLQAKHGPSRVIDTPVAESGIVGAAFGMAVAGLRPIAEIQFMGFSYPAYDQIISHVSRIRNRSRHRFTAPMVIRIPYGAGIGAAEHHSESSEVIYAHTPGLKVVVPSNPYDAKGMLLAAVADPDPVIFLEPIRLYRAVKGDVPDVRYEVPLGEAAVVAEGDDLTLIGYGAMMREVRQAVDALQVAGISAGAVDLRSLAPLDLETIVEQVEHTGRAVVVQEAPRTAGFAAEVAASLQERALYSLRAPIERVTGWDTIVPLRRAEHHYMPTVERILAAARTNHGGLMATEFHLPDIGEGLTEAVIIDWYVAVGEEVLMDAPLVEVETDKAVVDIPSPVAGVLLHRGAGNGEVLAVDALLAVVGDAGETWVPATPADETVPAGGGGEEAAPIVGRLEEAVETVTMPAGLARMLPRVRRLAAELGVTPDDVVGTGPGGRITEEDVRAAATATTQGPVRRVRMSPMRRTIAERVSRSWREIPHVTIYDEANAGEVFAERTAAGKPPLEAVLMRRLLPLLEEYPDFNAVVEGNEIVHKLHYDIGFAVDTPDGLMVAVVKDAASHDVDSAGAEITRLATAARDRTADPAELRGQTFTMSNIGAVGGGYGTPIIPLGTTAILSIGRAQRRPVVRGEEIVVRTEMPLSLSYDHRAIDGATGRAFLGAVVDAFESPSTA